MYGDNHENVQSFDFSYYVAFAAENISKRPYAQYDDEFRTNPNGCFVSAFIIKRLEAADDISKRYPRFNTLVTKITESQGNLTADKFFEERQLATDISHEYAQGGDTPNEILLLLLLGAYAAVLFQGLKDEKTITINNMIFERAISRGINKGGWKDFFVSVMMWFLDRNGYRNETVNQYADLNETLEWNYQRIDLDLYALIGAKIYGQYDGSIDFRFTSALIQFKLQLADMIAKRHQEFTPVYEFFCNNANNSDLSGEFDEIFNTPDLISSDVYCAILVASLGTFLDRNNPDRSTSENCIACVETAMNNSKEVIEGFPAISLLCVALWFSDYNGYKKLVYSKIEKLLVDGWYSKDKDINLNEVKQSI